MDRAFIMSGTEKRNLVLANVRSVQSRMASSPCTSTGREFHICSRTTMNFLVTSSGVIPLLIHSSGRSHQSSMCRNRRYYYNPSQNSCENEKIKTYQLDWLTPTLCSFPVLLADEPQSHQTSMPRVSCQQKTLDICFHERLYKILAVNKFANESTFYSWKCTLKTLDWR